MPKLPRDISGEQLVKALCKQGFNFVRQKGSHVFLKCPVPSGPDRATVVPMHDDLAPGTLKSILNQAGVDIEDIRGDL